MYLADWVLRGIDAELGSRPPERGAALLGPRHRPLVAQLVPDPEGAVSSTRYEPSRWLAARVRELERDSDLELKGIVHSHPDGLDTPSEQDAQEFAAARDVPHPDRLVLGARHEDAIGRVQGDAHDAGVVRTHLDAQYRLRRLRPGRFPCGQHSQKGENQTNG